MTRRKPPADVVIYYDRPTRAWWAFQKDANGNQIGEAVNAYTYDDCLDDIIEQTKQG